MPTSDDSVWIAVTSDGTVTAWDTADAARNHLRDEPGQVWVEHVTINRTQEAAGAPSAAEQGQAGTDAAPTRETGTRRRTWVSPPALTLPGRWTGPDGPAAA